MRSGEHEACPRTQTHVQRADGAIEDDLIGREPGIERPRDHEIGRGGKDVDPRGRELVIANIELPAIIDLAVAQAEAARAE